MILGNPLVRFMLKVCGLAGGQRDVVASREAHAGQGDSPFVLVTRAADGRWGVFQQDYDKPLASFDELQEACDFANERAKTQTDSMVLIGRRREAPAHPDSSIAQGTT